MVRDYLQELKAKGGYSWSDVANLSNIPEATVRKIIMGETENPRIDTVISLVTALGGSMDGIVDAEKKEEIEMNALAMLRDSYEKRIVDIKEHIKSLNKDKRVLISMVIGLIAFILFVLIIDMSVRTHGWIQY